MKPDQWHKNRFMEHAIWHASLPGHSFEITNVRRLFSPDRVLFRCGGCQWSGWMNPEIVKELRKKFDEKGISTTENDGE